MSARILISLSARRVTMALYQGGLTQLRNLPHDAAASQAFGELLAAHPRVPVYMMVDVVEEDYRAEALPHVMGGARQEMVARKLTQFYRSTPYRAAWRQGRASGSRRDDQYLFVALNNSEFLRPYLDLVESHRSPLAGIYLLPMVSQAVVRRTRPASSNVLLVSLQGSGLRQSFFQDGQLRISRLTPLDYNADMIFSHAAVEEIGRSRLFLHNTRLLARDTPLDVWLLDAAGRFDGVPEQLAPDTGFVCRVLDAPAIARVAGQCDAEGAVDTDVVFLCMLARHRGGGSLALPQQTRGFTYHQWRFAMTGLAAGIAVAAVGMTGYNLYARSGYLDRAQAMRSEAATLGAQYAQVAAGFPKAPASAEDMRAAVTAVDGLRRHAHTPQAALGLLGGVLQAYPTINLNRLDWRYGEQQAANAGWREELDVEAEIRPFKGDYREALRLIERFSQSLRGRPGVAEVRVLQLPVDLNPKSGLSGNTRDEPAANQAGAQFKLALKFEAAK